MNIRGGLTPSLFAKNVWELGGGNPANSQKGFPRNTRPLGDAHKKNV